MAISAISSISGTLPPLYPSRSHQAEGAPKGAAAGRIQPIPSLAVREDTRREDLRAEDRPGDRPADTLADERTRARRASLDPRGAIHLINRPTPETRGPARAAGRNETASRLDDLLGRKAALERRQGDARDTRSAEVAEMLSQLKARDSQVRAHEAAHMAAGGRYVTGGASYTYQQGPDGGEYAIGGEVGIDTSPVPGDPEATAQKMQIIRAAALAPSDPSAADLSVAAAAAETEAAAMAEIAQRQMDEAAKLGQPSPGARGGDGQGAGREGASGRREDRDVVG